MTSIRPLLSIIIPIYKVEDYLAQCLDSVYQQAIKKVEVICVNDGSPDNCREILAKYKEVHEDLIIIERENGGLSAARNTGFASAKGEYVFFLDSDDYLYNGILKEIIDLLEEREADISMFNSSLNGERDYYKLKDILITGNDGKEFYENFYKQNGFFPPSPVWMYIYRRSFLLKNNLAFVEGSLHDDEPYTVKAFFHAESVRVVPLTILYHRVFRKGSITQTASLINLEHARKEWNDLYNYLRLNGCNQPLFYHKIFELYISSSLRLNELKDPEKSKKFWSKDDFAKMKMCITSKHWYFVYFTLRYFPGWYNWYINTNKFRYLRKFMSKIITWFYRAALKSLPYAQ